MPPIQEYWFVHGVTVVVDLNLPGGAPVILAGGWVISYQAMAGRPEEQAGGGTDRGREVATGRYK